MNYNKHVFLLCCVFLSVLILFSVAIENYPNQFQFFKKISIISDIIHRPERKKIVANPSKDTISNNSVQNAYLIPHRIGICDQTNSTAVLFHLKQRIDALRQSQKGKIRIAWFGDSMIEGDLITQTIRKILQDTLGGHHAVGFVAPKTVSSNNRITARSNITGDFTTYQFHKTNQQFPLFFSGYVYSISNGVCTVTDNTQDSNDVQQNIYKYLVCGKGSESEIDVNGRPVLISPSKFINYILIDSSKSKSLQCRIKNEQLPVYGFSLEMQDGIVVDNFSFRGITGTEYNKIDTNLLLELNQSGIYDLIVFQFGVNLLFKPNDKEYTYYQRLMTPVLSKFKRCMPTTDFLIISTFDRAFKYDQGWESAIGIDTLVATQYRLSCNHQFNFYNLFQTMGGRGTIVRWADSATTLANHDYIHPNHKGASLIGATIAHDLLTAINKK